MYVPRLDLRIVINGATVHVFVRGKAGEPFQEVKPGAFRLGRLGPNGIILAMDSGQDNEGTWFEACHFSVTLKKSEAK
jgi:hypothetical protein